MSNSQRRHQHPNLTVRQQYARMAAIKDINQQCRDARRATRLALLTKIQERPTIFSAQTFDTPEPLDAEPQHQHSPTAMPIIDVRVKHQAWDHSDLKTLRAICGQHYTAANLSATVLSYMLAEYLGGNILVYGRNIWPQTIQNTIDLMRVSGQVMRYSNATSLEAIKSQSLTTQIRYAAIFMLGEYPWSFVEQDLRPGTRAVVWRVSDEHFAESSAVINQINGKFAEVKFFAPPWESAIYIVATATKPKAAAQYNEQMWRLWREAIDLGANCTVIDLFVKVLEAIKALGEEHNAEQHIEQSTDPETFTDNPTEFNFSSSDGTYATPDELI